MSVEISSPVGRSNCNSFFPLTPTEFMYFPSVENTLRDFFFCLLQILFESFFLSLNWNTYSNVYYKLVYGCCLHHKCKYVYNYSQD